MGKAAFLGTLHPGKYIPCFTVICGLQEFLIIYPCKENLSSFYVCLSTKLPNENGYFMVCSK